MKARRFVTLVVVLLSVSAIAAPPTKITITAETVGLPAGSTCDIEVGAEYRIMQRKAVTFFARAPERHRADLTPAAGARRVAAQLVFTMPGALPAPAAREYASISIPVKYRITIPGEPELVRESAYAFRVAPGDPQTLSRCLRIELLGEELSLRMGLLPTCKHRFQESPAVPIPQD